MSIQKRQEQCDLALQAFCYLRSRVQYGQGLCTYLNLLTVLGLKHPGQLPPILRIVMEECKERGEPLYPALVVGKDRRPGAGFFKQARDLGFKIEETKEAEEAFWFWQVYHRMELIQTTFEAEHREVSCVEPISILQELGYEVEFEPLVKNPPNAGALKGRRLVKIVAHPPKPDTNPYHVLLSQNPELKRLLSGLMKDGYFTQESTERVRQLRRELLSLALERLKIKSLSDPRPLETLPTGESPETASQLPG